MITGIWADHTDEGMEHGAWSVEHLKPDLELDLRPQTPNSKPQTPNLEP